jgi:hypothetical protein
VRVLLHVNTRTHGFHKSISTDPASLLPGQDGGHKVDVLFGLGVVPTAKDGVSSGQDGAPGVQGRRDASLGDGNGLKKTEKKVSFVSP